jgi:hypothetical protein
MFGRRRVSTALRKPNSALWLGRRLRLLLLGSATNLFSQVIRFFHLFPDDDKIYCLCSC